jgi:hypothetical protein
MFLRHYATTGAKRFRELEIQRAGQALALLPSCKSYSQVSYFFTYKRGNSNTYTAYLTKLL